VRCVGDGRSRVSKVVDVRSLRKSQMRLGRKSRTLANQTDSSPLAPPSGMRLLQTKEDLRIALQRLAEFERARGRYERAMAGRSSDLASP
jgi:hypothetical protein